jgi:hypothetical protein
MRDEKILNYLVSIDEFIIRNNCGPIGKVCKESMAKIRKAHDANETEKVTKLWMGLKGLAGSIGATNGIRHHFTHSDITIEQLQELDWWSHLEEFLCGNCDGFPYHLKVYPLEREKYDSMVESESYSEEVVYSSEFIDAAFVKLNENRWGEFDCNILLQDDHPVCHCKNPTNTEKIAIGTELAGPLNSDDPDIIEQEMSRRHKENQCEIITCSYCDYEDRELKESNRY